MSEQIFTTKENGALWAQLNGPNTQPVYLGCHDLADLDAPQGQISLLQCFDGNGGWLTIGATEKAPEPIKTTLTTYLGKTRDWLEKANCPLSLYVNLRDCGKPDVFTNYVRRIILDVQKVTHKKRSGLVMRSDDKAAEHHFEIEILPPWTDAFKMTALQQGTSEAYSLNDVVFCNAARCAGPCGDAQNAGDGGIITSIAASGSPSNKANVLNTANGGGTWSNTTAQPFAGAQDIGPAACFYVGRTTIRWLVALGKQDVANPAKVAYSDDGGATWTVVTVGSVNGQFANDSEALFALDQYHIWLVTNGGYIYFSSDGGMTWVAQSAGVVTTNTLRWVHFADEFSGYCGGASNTILKTLDGGTTWSLVTGPTAKTGVAVNVGNVRDANHLWVGYASATANASNLWYSNDGGLTWNQRAFAGSTTGSVDDIKFVPGNDYVGYLVYNTIAPLGTVYITTDGGYSWEAISTPTNAGLNAVAAISSELAYAVGNAYLGSGVILKISGG